MDFEKIKIELQEEDIKIIEELNSIQNRISDIESKNLNSELMNSIKQKSIETITMALGVSDVLEKRAHSNGLEASKEYKRYLKWENTPINKRSKNYNPKYLHKNEFKNLIETSKNTPKYNKEIRKTYEGKEFSERKNSLYSKEKPFSAIDGYTNEKINRFDKDLSKISNIEHINPIYETHQNPAMQKYLTQKERKEYVNSSENTCITRADINISKGKKSLEETKKWAENNQEKFNLNLEMIEEKVEIAKKKRDETLQNKQIIYKKEEQLQIAGANALKSGAKAAVGQLLTITVVEIIDEFKESNEYGLKDKIKRIQERISQKTSNLLETFKSHSINSFLSTLLDALLNSVLKILKNILKFIKAAFHSLIRAFKVLVSSEYSKEEKLSECRKILGATVATLIGLALDEIIEKALISFIPFTAPFAGYVSPILSGLIVGIGSVLIMHGWEKYKAKFELKKLKKEELTKIEKTSKISEVKAHISDAETSKSILITFNVFEKTLPIISSCKEQIETSIKNIKETSKKINQKLDEVTKVQDENSNLLSRLNTI